MDGNFNGARIDNMRCTIVIDVVLKALKFKARRHLGFPLDKELKNANVMHQRDDYRGPSVKVVFDSPDEDQVPKNIEHQRFDCVRICFEKCDNNGTGRFVYLVLKRVDIIHDRFKRIGIAKLDAPREDMKTKQDEVWSKIEIV
jgi:hypothetical protein